MKTLLYVLLAGTFATCLSSCYVPYGPGYGYGYESSYCPPPVYHHDQCDTPRHYSGGW